MLFIIPGNNVLILTLNSGAFFKEIIAVYAQNISVTVIC